jgi:simple sugar transport system ATP-binding protein
MRAGGMLPLGEPCLKVEGLSVKPLTCPMGLTNVTFTLHRGEILGVVGISGNGQEELVSALTDAADYRGSISRPSARSPGDCGDRVGYIPADRTGVGVAGSLSVRDNLSLRDFTHEQFSAGPFLRHGQIEKSARAMITAFDIHPPETGAQTSLLSGGNIQKVILARELAGDPTFVLAVTPTAGLDIATIDLVQKELVRHADQGSGVLIISEDLDELLTICNRILVLFAGQVVGIFNPDRDSARDIGLAMNGVRPAAATVPQVEGDGRLVHA